jgi:hypothetical protein
MQEPIAFTRYFDGFTKRVDAEIAKHYIEGCIHWVNTLYDDAWFKATERLERGLNLFRSGKISLESMQLEEEIFFEIIHEHTEKYKRYKKLDDRTVFLKSLEKGESK